MSNHLFGLLTHWHPKKDTNDWVLVTVVNVVGSNYRKPGAMMLVSDLGETFGLISGGCLEKALLGEVKKVISLQAPRLVEIDASEDGNFPSLGCGGKVSLWMQPVALGNNYQALDRLMDALKRREKIFYAVSLDAASINHVSSNKSKSDREMLWLQPSPPWHLGIFGGGVDAKPIVAMAQLMGWEITVVENRIGFALAEDFPNAQIVRAAADSDQVKSLVNQLDAAILMNHNLALDALAIPNVLHVDYVGLLGPKHRREKVFALAGLQDNSRVRGSDFSHVRGPMGINIGGDLPESIALSVLAEIHQVLEARDRANRS